MEDYKSRRANLPFYTFGNQWSLHTDIYLQRSSCRDVEAAISYETFKSSLGVCFFSCFLLWLDSLEV